MVLNHLKKISPIISVIFTLLIQIAVPNAAKQPDAKGPYFTFFLYIVGGIFVVLYAASFFNKKINDYLLDSGPLLAGGAQLLNFINLICSKFARRNAFCKIYY